MSFYEHTFVGKQDISEKDVNNIASACTQIIEKSGKVLKTEKWGLLNLSHKIKKNRKGIFVHFKFAKCMQYLLGDLYFIFIFFSFRVGIAILKSRLSCFNMILSFAQLAFP